MKKIDNNLNKAAEAVLQVTLAGIEHALRKVTVERGLSAGDKPLVPFGGAGGLLACDLAELMGMHTVLIPHSPGLLCAFGMLHTPASRDLSHTVLVPGDDDGYDVAVDVSRQLAERAEHDLRDGGVKGRFKTVQSIDIRYEGQSFDLNVPLTKYWRRDFEKAHNRVYETDSREQADCEIVAVRVRVEAGTRAEKAISWKSPVKKGKPVSECNGMRVFERNSLKVGQKIAGPAIVTELSTCVYVKAGWNLAVAESGQLILSGTGGSND